MKPTVKVKLAILEHAKAEFPRECCGLIVVRKGRAVYVPCRNVAESNNQFRIDETDFAAAEDRGDIVTIVHSHPTSSPNPSKADLTQCEVSGLPWYIVNPLTGADHYFSPSGYYAPLHGREWIHGIHDCYSLIRDWYKEERGIDLPDFDREDEWWLKGKNLYHDNLAIAGFVVVPFEEMQIGDMLLMQIGSTVESHAALYIGENEILHHPRGRISGSEVYGGYWRKVTTTVCRYVGRQ
jgi:proteasome lid subunit RPN8/RPN11